MLNISQSKKTSEKRGKNSSKESRSQECKVQGRDGGWTNLHHTHLPPDAKKKKREAPQSILYYSIHRDEGVQEAEGGGGRFKR